MISYKEKNALPHKVNATKGPVRLPVLVSNKSPIGWAENVWIL